MFLFSRYALSPKSYEKKSSEKKYHSGRRMFLFFRYGLSPKS